jgi:hypothetical protein
MHVLVYVSFYNVGCSTPLCGNVDLVSNSGFIFTTQSRM